LTAAPPINPAAALPPNFPETSEILDGSFLSFANFV